MKNAIPTRDLHKLRTTLTISFIALSLIPLIAVALYFLDSHSRDLEDQSHAHLISMRDTRKQQITDYMESRRSEVTGFVRSELAFASGGRFYGLVNAFQRLGANIEEARRHARQRYILNSGDKIKTETEKSSDNYIGSERYRLLHKRYHSTYQEYLNRSDFDDILLVDIQGNVTYSVIKSEYFGVNLLSDEYQLSSPGKALSSIQKAAIESNPDDAPPVIMFDYTEENGNLNAWFAAPIMQQGYLHSYALFRLPLTGLSELFSDNSDIADTLVVGADFKTRTLQQKQPDIDKHRDIIKAALEGNIEVKTYSNSEQENVIAAYAPLSFMGLNWAISVQLEENTAYTRVHQLEKLSVFIMLLTTGIVILASHTLSSFITHPLNQLTLAAERVSAGELDEEISGTSRKDEIGRLAASFAKMQSSIRQQIETIENKNRELRLADKLKDEFLATTSHELRTPLHGMIGIAEVLSSDLDDPVSEDQKHQLDIIVSSGQRLSKLVDDLQDYHKMRYGHLEIHPQPADLFNTTSLVLQLSTHLLGSKRIRIINQIPTELPAVSADPERLEQVLYNLIGNAIKFTREGKIVLSALELEESIRVQVTDTGQGIPAEELERIFEPLIQTSYTSKGTGLGLSISRQLIELMGGTLYVSSQPHVGTTFSFTLPVSLEPSDTTTVQDHFRVPKIKSLPDPEQVNMTQKRETEESNAPLVLIAEDETINLHVINSFLRNEGYRVKTVTDGCEVFKQVEQERPAILLLDIMLPGIDGYEICHTLRQEYDDKQLPIIMLTALSQPEDIRRGFEAGTNDYLSKPFSKKELLARITAHLSASKARQKQEENLQLRQKIEQQKQRASELLSQQQSLQEQLKASEHTSIGIEQERVQNLETALDVLSEYAVEGGSEKLEQLQSLGEEFSGIVNRVTGDETSRDQQLREVLVSAMRSALDYWERSTGKTKFDFAEQSGLWRVYLDRSTLQTRTLDKYLRVETLPKTPRWRTVLSSIDYILDNCSGEHAYRNDLEEFKQRITTLIK